MSSRNVNNFFRDFLLPILLSILEMLFQADHHRFPQHGNGSSDSPPNSNSTIDKRKKLRDAFELFGSSLDEANKNNKKSQQETRDIIKKSFRRLSLIHHPDRNEGSQESHEKMQQINAQYELCCNHLDELEGLVVSCNDDDESSASDENNNSGRGNEKRKAEPKKNNGRQKNKKKKGRRGNNKSRYHHHAEEDFDEWYDDDDDDDDHDRRRQQREYEKSVRVARQKVNAEKARLEREEKNRKFRERGKKNKQQHNKKNRRGRGRRQRGGGGGGPVSTSSSNNNNNNNDSSFNLNTTSSLQQQHEEWIKACSNAAADADAKRRREEEYNDTGEREQQQQQEGESVPDVTTASSASDDSPTSSSRSSSRSSNSMHDIDDDEENETFTNHNNDGKFSSSPSSGRGDPASSSSSSSSSSPSPSSSSSSNETTATTKKPKHRTLEQCPDQLAIAVKLGHAVVVRDMITNSVMKYAQQHVMNDLLRMHGSGGGGISHLQFKMALDEFFSDSYKVEGVFFEVLLRPLDGDNNTLLHYICYAEQSEILSVVSMLFAGSRYHDLLLQENARGQIPMDFCCCCAVADDDDDHRAFQERVRIATETAKQTREDNKPINRFTKLVESIHVWKALYVLSSFFVGYIIFDHGSLVCGIALCLATISIMDFTSCNPCRESESEYLEFTKTTRDLFIYHMGWKAIRTVIMKLLFWIWSWCVSYSWWATCLIGAISVSSTGPTVFVGLAGAIIKFVLLTSAVPVFAASFLFQMAGACRRLTHIVDPNNIALCKVLYLIIFTGTCWVFQKSMWPLLNGFWTTSSVSTPAFVSTSPEP